MSDPIFEGLRPNNCQPSKHFLCLTCLYYFVHQCQELTSSCVGNVFEANPNTKAICMKLDRASDHCPDGWATTGFCAMPVSLAKRPRRYASHLHEEVHTNVRHGPCRRSIDECQLVRILQYLVRFRVFGESFGKENLMFAGPKWFKFCITLSTSGCMGRRSVRGGLGPEKNGPSLA